MLFSFQKPLKRVMIEQMDATSAVSPQSLQSGQPSLHNGQPSATTSSQPLTTSSIPTATSCNTESQTPRTASRSPHPPADSTVEEIGRVPNIQSTTSNQSSEAVQPTSQGRGQPSKAKSDSADSISLTAPCSKIVELSETRTSQSSMSESQTTPSVEGVESAETRTAVPAVPKTQATPSSDATAKDTLPGATRMLVSEVETEDQRGGQLVGAESGCGLKMPSVPPTSSIQFQADWKKLRRDRNMLAQYFKVSVFEPEEHRMSTISAESATDICIARSIEEHL